VSQQNILILILEIRSLETGEEERRSKRRDRRDALSYVEESQGDSVSKPRVARNELPWEYVEHNCINPNRGCGVFFCAESQTNRVDATSSRLVFNQTFLPKVARKLATLGFVAQSRWDWKSETGVACRSQRGSDFTALADFWWYRQDAPSQRANTFLCALFRRLR